MNEENKNSLFDIQSDLVNLIVSKGLEKRDFAFTYVNGKMMLVDLMSESVQKVLGDVRKEVLTTDIAQDTDE